MSTVRKSGGKNSHGKQCLRVKDSSRVTSTPQICLSLPACTWQAIILMLTSENNRLRQQVDRLNNNSTTLSARRQPNRTLKERVTCCKQTACKREDKPVIMHRECGATDKDRCVFTNKTGDGYAKPGDLLTQTRRAERPHETTQTGTSENQTECHNHGQLFQKCSTLQQVRSIVNRSVQTDALVESRAVNTTFKFRQQKSQLLRPAPSYLPPPAPPFNIKFQQRNENTMTTSPATDGLTQEQLPTQDKEVEEKPEVIVTKIPQCSSELLFYTQQKIEQLTHSGIILLPEKKREICVFCKKEHNVSVCTKLPEESESRSKYNECYVCKEQHDLVNCKWVQVVDLLMSMTPPEQGQLLEVCPYLKEPIEHPERCLFYMFTWLSQYRTVQAMDQQCFRFPYFKKPKKRKQINQAEKASSNQDQVRKTRGKREVIQAERMTSEIPSKMPSRTTKNGQDSRQCFFCKDSSHLIKTCVLFQQKKSRRKINNLTRSDHPKTIDVKRTDILCSQEQAISRTT